MKYVKMDDSKKIAGQKGPGTGAGGILLGLADFPLFTRIKLNFYSMQRHCPEFDTSNKRERLFILLMFFQLAFSSGWITEKKYGSNRRGIQKKKINMDWESSKTQSTETNIDFAKMRSSVPIIGASGRAHSELSTTAKHRRSDDELLSYAIAE